MRPCTATREEANGIGEEGTDADTAAVQFGCPPSSCARSGKAADQAPIRPLDDPPDDDATDLALLEMSV